ncbi:MAG: DMT family transporter [Betaproteobacteria bacterium]|nr:DMT family transporter [Betaproteobacteria bacterium]
MLHADSARNRLTGIGIISLTYLLFALLDGSAKWLVQSVPVLLVVWLRFLTQALLAAALLLPMRGRALVRTRHLRWHVVRGLMFCAMTGGNFWALQYLQLTVTASIFFTVPILIALMSAPLLGERMDARRWAAILAGFAGVLVIVRPGSAAFHPAMLLSMGNAVLYAAFNLMTRKLAAYDSPETIQFLPAVVASVVLAPFALAVWASPPGAFEWLLLCLMGVLGGTGHYLLAVAHRYAPASMLAPFLYQQILYMAAFGYLVFGSVPDAAVWIGAAIVVASGLYLFARERRGR